MGQIVLEVGGINKVLEHFMNVTEFHFPDLIMASLGQEQN